MQERRTTVRYLNLDRAQYCGSEDLLPRDGRVANVSERGAGLLLQESHPQGERITVSFALDGEQEPLTATGHVRWSTPKPLHGRWFPVGLEWLPLEDGAKERLAAFLNSGQTETPGDDIGAPFSGTWWNDMPLQRLIARAGLIFAIIALLLSSLWIANLHMDNRALQEAVEERNAVIGDLKDQSTGLQQDLAQARADLDVTVAEIDRLDQQSEHFANEMAKLNQAFEEVQDEYQLVRQEYMDVLADRQELAHDLYETEKSRTELMRRLGSMPELVQAIREAKAARAGLNDSFEGARESIVVDRNEGYLVRDGFRQVPTTWIQVHDPEAGGLAP